jgi:hypothetical protein
MSEGGALVRFHDWRAARDRKAAPPALALPLRRAGGGACVDWACHPGAGDRHVILLHPAAHSGAEVQHRLLTYRIIKEICNAARELARSTRTLCPIGVKGSRVLRHPHRGSSPTMLDVMSVG